MNDCAHIVLIADQVGSRRAPDAVPAALELLAGVDTVLPFERTAGDEIQGLLPDGDAAVRALTLLWRVGAWSIGVGIGAVEEPLPESTREARGGAYLAARRAIEASGAVAARIKVELEPRGPVLARSQSAGDARASSGTVGSASAGNEDRAGTRADVDVARGDSGDAPPSSVRPDGTATAHDAETVLHLLEPLVRGRSAASWEALDLSLAGQSQAQIGERLGITQGAVSRRLARAYAPEVERASDLAARLLDEARRGS